MKFLKIKPLLLFLLLAQTSLFAELIQVPAETPSIQEAIELASTGDTIAVSPGEYFENINFRGKDVLLTSLFYLNQDPTYIDSTIINGSLASIIDTGSVVVFINNEGPDAILQGFTITGGIGTIFFNNIENFYVRVGGGILIDRASPTIRFNKIIDNKSTHVPAFALGAGGGGIRAARSRVKIENNIIADNRGLYAGGLMLANCYPSVRNNLIIGNSAGGDFDGGGGIYIDFALYADSIVQIVNNTIVNNSSGKKGGGLIITGVPAKLINNIIYGNTATQDSSQIFERGFAGVPTGQAILSYSNIERGWSGDGNIDTPPLFADTLFHLASDSPCIDAGDPDINFNDREDDLQPGMALAPSLGSTRNDMGAYGGPLLNQFFYEPIVISSSNQNIPRKPKYNLSINNPASPGSPIYLDWEEMQQGKLQLLNLNGQVVADWKKDFNSKRWETKVPEVHSGIYILHFQTDTFQSHQKVFILPH